MAYSGKSEQRLAGSVNYKGSEATLNSLSVKGPASMAKGNTRLVGKMGSSGTYKLYGKTESAGNYSGIAGPMSDGGYTKGPRWKGANEPGDLKVPSRSQKGSTVRMTPGQGRKEPVMHVTSTTPKALRGGRVR